MSVLTGTTVLCGAGISRLAPSSLPNGEQLSRELITLVRDGHVDFDVSAFDAVDEALRPDADGEQRLRLELVFELLARHVDPRLLVGVFELLQGAEPNANHLGLLASGARILTLNQDILFEDAARALGLSTPDDCVIHLHGRSDRPQTIITLISEYLAGLPPNLASELHDHVRDQLLVVVGYSGRDRDVMPALARARPREVVWVQHSPDGGPRPCSPELAALMADTGIVRLQPERDPDAWIASQLDRRETQAVRRAQSRTAGRAASVSSAATARFRAIGDRERILALGRLLNHVGELDALEAGLQRLRYRNAGKHPDVELALAAVISARGEGGRAARRYASIARRHRTPEIVCEASLWRAEALSNLSRYPQARVSLARLRRSASRLPAPRREHYLAWAAERGARMKGMTDDEAGALRDYARAQALFDQINDVDGRIAVRTFKADMLRSRGRYHEALDMLTEAMEDGDLFSRAYYQPWPRFYVGGTLGVMGRTDEALRTLEDAQALAQRAANWQAVIWLSLLRCCFERRRSLSAAEAALTVAERDLGIHGKNLSLAHARVLFERAELARAHGDEIGCRDSLRDLRGWIRTSVPGHVPYLVAHANAVDAELARDLGDSRAERLLLSSALEYRSHHWAGCEARMRTSLWLHRGGPPPKRLTERCRREGYGVELARLEGREARPYYALHNL